MKAQLLENRVGGRAKRPLLGIATNAISSSGNFLLAIGIAREVSVDQFGHFAVAFSIYVLATGLCRAAVAEQVLALVNIPEAMVQSSRLVVSTGLIIGSTVAVIAIVTEPEYLLPLAVSLPGLALYEHVKNLTIGVGQPRIALVQEVVWGAVVGSTFVVVTALDGNSRILFVVWAASGAGIGIFQALRLRYSLRPGWRIAGLPPRTTVSYGLEYIAGSGCAQLITTLLVVVASAQVVGALRAAGTVLAPVTILIATARGLLIAHFSHVMVTKSAVVGRHSAAACGGLATAVAVYGLALLFLPNEVGSQILGSSWEEAVAALPALTVELIFAAVTVVSSALHRAMKSGSRGLLLEVGISPLRLVVILLAGAYFGVAGAAAAMAFVAMVGAISWWVSFTKAKASWSVHV